MINTLAMASAWPPWHNLKCPRTGGLFHPNLVGLLLSSGTDNILPRAWWFFGLRDALAATVHFEKWTLFLSAPISDIAGTHSKQGYICLDTRTLVCTCGRPKMPRDWVDGWDPRRITSTTLHALAGALWGSCGLGHTELKVWIAIGFDKKWGRNSFVILTYFGAFTPVCTPFEVCDYLYSGGKGTCTIPTKYIRRFYWLSQKSYIECRWKWGGMTATYASTFNFACPIIKSSSGGR